MTGTVDPRIGSQLGAYRIEAVIGRGGMGVVYRATDTGLDRRVALKLIAPSATDDEAFRARFLRESRMAAAIDHPNIIPIYEAAEVEGTYVLAMRFVDGTDLEHRLREGPLEPRAAAGILGQIASALDAAHAAGLVHRDVKPANVLVASGQGTDGADHAYLTDFGLTKQSGSETGLTRRGGFVGTLEYIAPEQIEGKAADGRSDQYALAGIAVACLSGQVPFPRDSDVALINAHLHDAPPSVHLRRPEVPIEVDAVIARGLAKDPADRYPDCRTMIDDLRGALGLTAVHPRPIDRPARDRRPLALVGGLLLVVLLGVVAFGLLTSSESPSGPSDAPSQDIASPSTVAGASPTDAVYPNPAEQALLEGLPDDLQRTCARGPYGVIVGNSGGGAPEVSLLCMPSVTAGANEVLIRRFALSSASHGLVPGFISSIAAGEGAPGWLKGDGLPIAPGDCATKARANGRWSIAGEDVGPIACFTAAASGDAFLWWGYDDDAILVRAVNQRGDAAALYDWFENNALFIGR